MDSRLRVALEKENEQYIKAIGSDSFRIGKRISDAGRLLKKGKIKSLAKRLFSLSNSSKVPIDSNAQTFFADAPFRFGALLDEEDSALHKRAVVYTCITGGYDDPVPLLYKEPGVDYFLITDTAVSEPTINGWDVISIKGIFDDPFVANRYCKTHPFDFFPNHDLAIYLDGNVRPISDISRFGVCALASKSGIAAHGHSERTCVYDEAEACLLKGKGSKKGIESWVVRLKDEGMPRNFGLLEMSVIYYDLGSSTAKSIADTWWETLMSTSSRRDQLVLPYVVWKSGMDMGDFGIVAPSLRTNYAFGLTPWHDGTEV